MGLPAPQGVAASGQPPTGDGANVVVSGSIAAVGPTPPFPFRGILNLAIWAAINTALTVAAGSLAATVASGTGLAAGNAINSSAVPKGATIGALSGTNVTLALPPVTYPGLISTYSNQITNLPVTDGLLGATVSGYSGIVSGTTVAAIVQPAIPSIGQLGIVQMSAKPTTAPTSTTPIPLTFAPNGNAVLATATDAAALFTGAAIKFSGTVQLERSFDGGATWIVCNIDQKGTLAQWDGTTGPIDYSFGEPENLVLYRLNCIALSSGTINYRMSQTASAARSLDIGQIIG